MDFDVMSIEFPDGLDMECEKNTRGRMAPGFGLISGNDGVPITDMGKDACRTAPEGRSGAQFQE